MIAEAELVLHKYRWHKVEEDFPRTGEIVEVYGLDKGVKSFSHMVYIPDYTKHSSVEYGVMLSQVKSVEFELYILPGWYKIEINTNGSKDLSLPMSFKPTHWRYIISPEEAL